MIKNRTAALANPLQEYSVQKRMETWMGIIYTSFYFPLGKGQGTTGYAHSYYFLVLGEIGYPGFLCFLTILWVGFYRGMKVISNSKDKDTVELLRLLVTIIFMLTVLNLTGTHLHTPPGDIFFWFTMGCISRFYRQWRDQEALEKSALSAQAKTEKEQQTPTVPGPQLPGRAVSLPGAAHV
jgi:O-antigen ligase